MKKILLQMIVCAIGMVVPQGVYADVIYDQNGLKVETSDGGKTVTITSEYGGALYSAMYSSIWGYNTLDDDIEAIKGEGSKIVFVGEFHGDDLEMLHEEFNMGSYTKKNCCVQETVDMADAVFTKAIDLSEAASQYRIVANNVNQLSNSIPQNARPLQNGDIGVVRSGNGWSGYTYTFYVYDSSTSQWTETDDPCFTSEERMKQLINTPTQGNTSYYAQALVDGTPKYFSLDPHYGWGNYYWSGPLQSTNAYDEMTFSYWGNKVKTAKTSNYVGPNDALSSNMFQGCSNLESLTLGSGSFNFFLGNASSFPKLSTITVKNKVSQLGALNGSGFFPSSASLNTITFETGGTTPLLLCEKCFNDCKNVETVTIPARTSLIQKYAFGGMYEKNGDEIKGLKTVTFESNPSITYPMVIKKEAFNNTKGIEDVWVDIDPDVRPLVCEYEAFDFDAQDGQTAPANPMATLHFNKNYFDYYAGDWKKGMSMGHLELLAFRDGVGIFNGTKGQTSQLVNQTTNQAILGSESDALLKTGQIAGKKPANGWQQFAKTSTGIDIIIEKGKDLMSFSTPIVLVKPDWMHLYRITAFTDGYENGMDASSRELADAANKEATATEVLEGVEVDGNNVYCIPTNTGYIRVDFIDKDVIYYFKEWNDLTASDSRYTYDEAWGYPYKEANEGEEDKVNFLKPTTLTNGEDRNIGPTVKDESGTITHRIFGFKKIQISEGVNHGEFLRAKLGTQMKSQRAYLCLPASLFHWTNEGWSSNPTNDNENFQDGTTSNSGNSKVSLIIDADFDLGFDNGIATAVKQAVEEEMYKNDSFYTLQGVKVAKPTKKGVYIHNGKKIYVK